MVAVWRARARLELLCCSGPTSWSHLSTSLPTNPLQSSSSLAVTSASPVRTRRETSLPNRSCVCTKTVKIVMELGLDAQEEIYLFADVEHDDVGLVRAG